MAMVPKILHEAGKSQNEKAAEVALQLSQWQTTPQGHVHNFQKLNWTSIFLLVSPKKRREETKGKKGSKSWHNCLLQDVGNGDSVGFY